MAIEAPSTKSCNRCLQTKPTKAFVKNRSGSCGSMCMECRNEARRARKESSRRRAAETPEERRTRQLWESYRLTPEMYQTLLAAQNGACAICRKAPGAAKPLAVDHCHNTGVVRALLCNVCNLHVGIYEQSREAALSYLARYGDGNPLLKR